MAPIIEIKNIGKKYNITHERGRYIALRDVIMNTVKSPLAFIKSKTRKIVGLEQEEEYWALKDINLSVEKGEVIGIIGRNGAGKSTLLKILSQITPPSEGEIVLRGRVGSLLEVGTGFHPELTGRENIFLNGAILGMSRSEVSKKFEEIVEFADIRQFLDTPIKRYSSGMYVRLAFSVAAHMEPDILLIDEVLAVGDTEFQKKCLGKMDEMTKKSGRTIIFVSHNMITVEQLCKKVIILKKGRVDFIGPVKEGISKYLNPKQGGNNQVSWDGVSGAPGNDIVRIKKACVHNADHKARDSFSVKEKIGVTMEYEILKDGYSFSQGINLNKEDGTIIFYSHDVATESPKNILRKKGLYSSTVWLPENFLSDGLFSVGAIIFQPNPFEVYTSPFSMLFFRVIDGFGLDSSRGMYNGDFPGIIRPKLEWETKKIN